jgi:hypothetical protein
MDAIWKVSQALKISSDMPQWVEIRKSVTF